LDELGFGDAVTWQIREFARHSGLQLHMHLPAQDWVRDPVLATALFRIVQEALNNVVRHAQAGNVWVDLQSDEADLILRVRDDGQGMAATSGPIGMGLSSMRERARAVGGRLEIVSAPGQGCSVTLRLALSALPSMPRAALREEVTV
jgi:signal transduction histidine kinase